MQVGGRSGKSLYHRKYLSVDKLQVTSSYLVLLNLLEYRYDSYDMMRI